jgi:FKBP-type peptidyl-prolyl cis-trans isomerase 2
MTQAKKGSTVKVHYTGILEDGMVFDSSLDRDPLQFRIGGGEIIPGFEQAVIGMEPGEQKSAKVAADKAFGPHDQEKVYVIDRSKLPPETKVGQRYELEGGDGPNVVTVTEVSEGSVTLDGNHPLAGRDLIFDIQLLEVM